MSDIAKKIAGLTPEQRALLLARLRDGQGAAAAGASAEPVAVVGMGCRFPGGAVDPQAFWELLKNGGDGVQEVPAGRWDVGAFYDPDPSAAGKMSTRWGGFLDGVEGFDYDFFGISPREAARTDPQQRLLLEVAWEALEDAGLTLERLGGSATGVFVGISTSDYSLLQLSDPGAIDAYTSSGSALSIAANRLSFLFDLRGPSVAVDTACSSSLVAAHLACQSLRQRECDVALAGGVNLLLSPLWTVSLSKWGVMAADGRCKAFDASADGFVRGEGCGVVVLKRLADALADGDDVLAVIRGSAVNQDGRSTGMTAPNGPAQEAVIRRALAAAGVPASQVGYVEAHGTGTALGDPIEVESLAAVLGGAGRGPCVIGSVKTNIGHLEAAAGIAGLIKAVLAIRHGEIPPNLHFGRLNPLITLDGAPFVFPTRPRPWGADAGRRFAGVSSFGFGGTNAHLVLEEPPAPARAGRGADDAESATLLLPLSARSEAALKSLAGRIRESLSGAKGEGDAALRDVCYSAALRRSHHGHRLAVVAGSRSELVEGLEAFRLDESRAGVSSGERSEGARARTAFVFSGQGSQWAGMGAELFEREPVFRRSVEECDEALKAFAGWSLISELRADASRSRLDQTEVAQPAIFAVQVALAALWRSWGITPGAVVGHSVGEAAAAHVAGSLGLTDALKVICARSRLMQRAAGEGSMVAVGLSAEEAALALDGYEQSVAVAATNAARSVVLSGDSAALAGIVRVLQERGVYCRQLEVNYAFHSPQMSRFERELVGELRGVAPLPASVRFYSTVTGERADGNELDAAYWGRNMTATVRFAQAVGGLLDEGFDTFVEVGPRPVLSGSVAEMLRGREVEGRVLPSMRRDSEPRRVLLDSLGALYVRGHEVDWARVQDGAGRFVRLPSYPWQRERCWFEVSPSSAPAASRATAHDPAGGSHAFLRGHQALAHPAGTHLWTIEVSKTAFEYLEDHRIQHAVVLPGTAYAEMVLAASAKSFGDRPRVLKELEFQKALFLPDGDPRTLQLILTPDGEGEATFRLYSRAGAAQGSGEGRADAWTLHVTGRVADLTPTARALDAAGIEEIKGRCREEIPGGDFYALMSEKGNQWGPCFQGVARLWKGDGEVIGEVRPPRALESQLGWYQLHPALADACGQVLAVTRDFDERENQNRGAFMGGGVSEVRFYRRPTGGRLWSHARVRRGAEAGAAVLEGDASVYDETGQLVVEFAGIRFRYLEQGAPASAAPKPDEWFYELRWELKGEGAADPGAAREAPAPPPAWLIFADRGGVGDALRGELEARGDRCALVFQGDAYASDGGARFEVRADRPAEVGRVLGEFCEPGRQTSYGVVHLWSLDAPATEGMSASTLAAAQGPGSESLLHLLKHWARAERGGRPPRLWVVTRGAQAAGEPPAAPSVAQAPVWGLGRTVAREYPAASWGGLVDVDPGASARETAAALARELLNGDGEDQVALRRGGRYVARLVRYAPRPAGRAAAPQLLANATYLVTGGLGDLGLHVARWMVGRGARRLILAGRTPLPARATWGEVEPGTELAARVEAVRELESLGASVHLAALDVADEARVRSFVETFRREGWPPLRGVVHAAGVMHYGPAAETTAEELNAVLRPKILGAWLLHSLLADAPLDFFVLFSSMSSVLNSPFVGSYAAANAFLDALAHYRRARGLPALSINWGPWDEVGMAARRLAQRAPGAPAPQEAAGISPRQGLEALERLFGGETPAQVGVMPVDWQRWRQTYPAYTDSPLLERLLRAEPGAGRGEGRASAAAKGATRERLLALPPELRQESVEQFVREQVGVVMGLPAAKLDVERPLSQLGIDSLMAVELKNRVELAFKTVMPMVHFLQGPSIRRLSSLLLEQVSDAGGGAAEAGADSEWEILKI